MKKLLLILLTITGLLFSEETEEKKKKNSYFVDNFLKYSTFYFSIGLDSPFAPAQKFKVDTQAGTFEETTKEIEASYNLTVGVRKLARFKYQVKKNNFYDGSENELSEKQAQSKFGMIVKKYISKFIGKPVKNPKGKKWVKKQLLLKKAGVK